MHYCSLSIGITTLRQKQNDYQDYSGIIETSGSQPEDRDLKVDRRIVFSGSQAFARKHIVIY